MRYNKKYSLKNYILKTGEKHFRYKSDQFTSVIKTELQTQIPDMLIIWYLFFWEVSHYNTQEKHSQAIELCTHVQWEGAAVVFLYLVSSH